MDSAPITLGHEFSGIVESVGPDVMQVSPGDRVVAVAVQGCGSCEACRTGSTQLCPQRVAIGLARDGGMAEYAVLLELHLVPVPEELDLAVAALGEPLAVAVNAVNIRAQVQAGQRVVVSGPGPIGILCAMLAKFNGAEVLLTGVEQDSGGGLGDLDRTEPERDRGIHRDLLNASQVVPEPVFKGPRLRPYVRRSGFAQAP